MALYVARHCRLTPTSGDGFEGAESADKFKKMLFRTRPFFGFMAGICKSWRGHCRSNYKDSSSSPKKIALLGLKPVLSRVRMPSTMFAKKIAHLCRRRLPRTHFD
jgi:hypothetical protein